MIRILRKDVQEFFASLIGAGLLLLWPLIILMAVAPLKDTEDNLLIYVDVSEFDPMNDSQKLVARNMAARLADLPYVTVIDDFRGDADIWDYIDQHDADAAVIWHDALLPIDEPVVTMQAGGAWYAYVRPRSHNHYRRLELSLQFAHAGAIIQGQNTFDTPTSGMVMTARDAIFPVLDWMYTEGESVGVVAAPPLFLLERNGPAPDNYVWLTPEIILIISTMITFIFASSALVKERIAGTIHLLIHNNNAVVSFLSKSIFPTLLGMISLLTMLIFSQTVLGFVIRPGWAGMLGFHAVSLMVVSLQGLTVSALVKSELGALVAALAYLIAMMLFSGVFFDVADGLTLANAISAIIPPTFIRDAWVAWLTDGSVAKLGLTNIQSIAAIAMVSLFSAFVAVVRLRRSL